MKKVIVFSLVLVMAAGVTFAADFGGTVFAGVKLLQGSSVEDSEIEGRGQYFRARIEGAGESDDGTFGGWLRFDGGRYAGYLVSDNQGGGYIVPGLSALAWWKPMEMLKMTIGGSPDGFYGKDGNARWMFYQMPSDVGIVEAGNAWGGGYIPATSFGEAFFGGFDSGGLMFDIRPADVFGMNVAIPYFINHDNYNQNRLIDIFKGTMVQFDVNLDGIGNIALTYKGTDPWLYKDEDSGMSFGANPDGIGAKFWLYFGLSAVDNLALDFGLGLKLPEKTEEIMGFTVTRNHPIDIGLAVKTDITDSFGLKARILAELGGNMTPSEGDAIKDPFILGLDLLPYIGISDSMKIYIGLGLTMLAADKNGADEAPDPVIGFHFNPYLQVGAEWGPTFYVGLRIWSDGVKDADDKTVTKFEVPIGIQVSF
jgi:hypothetical protein